MTAMIGPTRGWQTAALMDTDRKSFTLYLNPNGVLRPEAGGAGRRGLCAVGSGNSLASAVYGPQPLGDLARTGCIGVAGDAPAAQTFVDLFRLRPDR